MIIRLATNSTRIGPALNKLNAYSTYASSTAGSTPNVMRSADMPISAATSSTGRSGLTNTWPRLRDQTSSRKLTATPIWLRSATSQSNTPANSTPPATAVGLPSREAKKLAVKPQTHSCSVGQ